VTWRLFLHRRGAYFRRLQSVTICPIEERKKINKKKQILFDKLGTTDIISVAMSIKNDNSFFFGRQETFLYAHCTLPPFDVSPVVELPSVAGFFLFEKLI
jgi:hypothetical protein